MLEFLLEELKEMKKQADFVHHTNIVALYLILKSGYLETNLYDDSISARKDNELEIAVLRRSFDKALSAIKRRSEEEFNRKMSDLSARINGVKIYLYSNRILTSVRGIKKNPISEFNIRHKREFEEGMGRFYRKYNTDDKYTKKDFSRFMENLIKDKIKNSKSMKQKEAIKKASNDDYFFPEMLSFLKNFELLKEAEKTSIIKYDLMRCIIACYYSNLPGTIGREGEERFRLKDSSNGIPVNRNYMRIRIYKEFSDEDLNYFLKNDDERKDFAQMLDKYKSIFLVDKNFNILYNKLKG